MINAFIKGQSLKIVAPVIVADSIKYLEAKFHFQTSDWDGCSKWAHFSKGDVTYDIHLNHDDEITNEDNLNLSAGKWMVYLHGTKEDGTRITTEKAHIEVSESGILDGEPFPDVPVSALESLDARVHALEQGEGGVVPSNVELKSNRVQVIDENSDHEHYPTARAVFNAVENIGIELIGNENHNGSFVDINGIISAPIVGSVDGNVVTLSGNLAKGTYEVKYVLADGTLADIGTVEVV